jgi:hypothetical protein
MSKFALSLLYSACLSFCISLGSLPTHYIPPAPPAFLPASSTYHATKVSLHDSKHSKFANQRGPSVSSFVPSSTPSHVAVSRSSMHSFCTPSPRTPLSPLSPQTLQDMNIVLQRRLGFIIASATQVSRIASWYVDRVLLLHTHLTFYPRLQTLGPDGSWPASEIDYTTGCSAQRANWPASSHWARIRTYTSQLILRAVVLSS